MATPADALCVDDLTQARRDLAVLQARYNADMVRLEAQLTLALGRTEEEDQAELRGEAVFGAFDGMTSVAGTIIALSSKSTGAIVLAAVGLAVASACGMGMGEWLSDLEARGALRRALYMAAATATGTMVPAIPFFFAPKGPAFAIAGVLALGLSTLIGRLRHKRWKGYLQTYATIVVAGGLTALVAFLIPAAGG